MKKTFSIEQAEEHLPRVSRLLRRAQRFYDKIAWLLEANDVVVEVTGEDGFHCVVTDQLRVNKQFHKMYFKFYSVLEELANDGVILRDIEDGAVDFPTLINGKEVFLCWELGEKKIQFWHDGEGDRKPIVDLDEFL